MIFIKMIEGLSVLEDILKKKQQDKIKYIPGLKRKKESKN